MRTETFTQVGEQLKAGLSDIANTLSDLSGGVSERLRHTREDVERGIRRVRVATGRGIDETREQIKSHPLLCVALVASAAFIVGSLFGFAAAKGHRS